MILSRFTANARLGGLVILASSAFLLSACKDSGILNLQGNAMPPPEIRSFHAVLADEYKVLGEFAAEAPKGRKAADIFYGKSEAAAQGESIAPESLIDYKIPAFAKSDLTNARAKLIEALQNANTPANAPKLALAQVQFDCWLAFQPYQKKDGYIGCRETFQQAISQIDFTKPENKVATKKQAAPLPTDPRTIHFINDTMTLDQGAHDAIAVLAEESLARDGSIIVLTGYSKTEAHIEDTSNNAVRRIIAVRNALYQNGVDPDDVHIEFVKGGDPQDVDIELMPAKNNNT